MDSHQDVQQDRQVAALPVGTLAPEFTLPQTRARRIGLREFVGRPVVLVFYPMDWEPLSRDQLVLYEKFAHEFERLSAGLVGISVDSLYCHAAFAREAQLHFPLLADFQPRGRVAHLYGVYREAQGMSARALFVLDQRGRIRFSRAYPDFFNPGVDDLLTTLEALAAEDAEEAKCANESSHAEDTEHAEPTEDARAGGPTQDDTSPPGPTEARGTPGDGNSTE